MRTSHRSILCIGTLAGPHGSPPSSRNLASTNMALPPHTTSRPPKGTALPLQPMFCPQKTLPCPLCTCMKVPAPAPMHECPCPVRLHGCSCPHSPWPCPLCTRMLPVSPTSHDPAHKPRPCNPHFCPYKSSPTQPTFLPPQTVATPAVHILSAASRAP